MCFISYWWRPHPRRQCSPYSEAFLLVISLKSKQKQIVIKEISTNLEWLSKAWYAWITQWQTFFITFSKAGNTQTTHCWSVATGVSQFQDGFGESKNLPKAEEKRIRKHWSWLLVSSRLQKGLFDTLYEELWQNKDLFSYFCMSNVSFTK